MNTIPACVGGSVLLRLGGLTQVRAAAGACGGCCLARVGCAVSFPCAACVWCVWGGGVRVRDARLDGRSTCAKLVRDTACDTTCAVLHSLVRARNLTCLVVAGLCCVLCAVCCVCVSPCATRAVRRPPPQPTHAPSPTTHACAAAAAPHAAPTLQLACTGACRACRACVCVWRVARGLNEEKLRAD